MSDSTLDVFIGSLSKFMVAEIEPHLDVIDLHPLKPLPFDLHEKISTTGIFDLAEADEEFSSVESLVTILAKISASSAGIGAFVAYSLTGRMTKKLYAPDLESTMTGLAIFEENEIEFDRERIGLSLALRGGLVSGLKKSVMLAPRADLFAVLVGDGDGTSIAWIRKDDRHVKVGEEVGLLGIRDVPCADVSFHAAKPESITKLGKVDVHYTLALLSLLTASCACGTSTEALERAFAYACDRYQGGRQINEHDAIKLMYAKNSAALEAATAGIARAARAIRPGDPQRLAECLYAKIAAGDAAVNATLDAIQMHGGYGYMRDYGVEKRFRDATALSMLPLDGARTALVCLRLR